MRKACVLSLMAALAMGLAHVVYRGVLRPGTAPESAPPPATGIAAAGIATARIAPPGRIPVVPAAPGTEARPGVPTPVAAAPPAPPDIGEARRSPSGQASNIARLIEGATLLGEKKIEDRGRRKTVRVYDVGDGFKYRRVRVETVVTPSGSEQSTAMVADHLIVKRDVAQSETDFESMLKAAGLAVRKRMYTRGHYLVSPVDEAVPAIDAVEHLTDRLTGKAVEIAEPDFIVFSTGVPNDPRFNELWGLHNTGQSGGLADADIDAVEGWDLVKGSPAVVGVIDTGIDYNHPDLAANIWINPGEIPGDRIDNDGNGLVDDIRGWDFVNNDNDPMDDFGHGTHCAGTIGAVGGNGVGVVGVCWSIKMVPLKFLAANGFGQISDAVDAVSYATKLGVRLTSNSWGGGGFNQSLYDVIQAAGKSNQLFIAAAGNDGQDTDPAPHYPSAYNLDNIISVASVDRNATLSVFSNWGATSVDLAAPGGAILSTLPGDRYGALSGTSMATPHVAGACALYLSQSPDAATRIVKANVLASADRIPALEGRCMAEARLNLYQFLLPVARDLPFVWVESIRMSNDLGAANFFSPGETVQMIPTIRNLGVATAASVETTLTTTDTRLTLTNDTIALGNLERGALVTPAMPFTLQIPDDFPTPTVVPFQIECRDGDGDVWTRRFNLGIYTLGLISGTVTDLASGSLLEDVQVTYSGPLFSGRVSTGPNGRYAFKAADGIYRLHFKKAGYAPENRTAYIARPSWDVALTIPEFSVDTSPIIVHLAKGEQREITLDLRSVGNGTIRWALEDAGVLFSGGTNGSQASIPYVWNDISAIGRRIPITKHDQVVGPLELGFDFQFFGENFSHVRASENAFLTFTRQFHGGYYANRPLKWVLSLSMIAFLWDDYSFIHSRGDPSLYFHRSQDGDAIFQFSDVGRNGESRRELSAQVVLKRDHSILVYYKKVARPDSATIGLKGARKGEYYQVAHNQTNAVANKSALRMRSAIPFGRLISPPATLGRPDAEGRIRPGGTQTIRLNLDSRPFRARSVHTDHLVIRSNDVTGNGVVRIPVTIKVSSNGAVEFADMESLEHSAFSDQDGIPEAGERFDLNVTLENIGTNGFTASKARIASSDPHLTVLTAESTYEAIPTSASRRNTVPFVLAISPDVPAGHRASIDMTLTDGNGQAYPLSFEFEVGYLETVTGTVKLHGTDRPLGDVVVGVGSNTVRTDQNGHYTLRFTHPGTYTISAAKSNHLSVEETITLPWSSALDFILTDPQIVASVSQIDLVLAPGETYRGSFQLRNTGHGPLEWRIENSFTSSTSEPYEWNDIASENNLIRLRSVDDSAECNLGFNFHFYGETFDRFWVRARGLLNFNRQQSLPYNNLRMGDPETPGNLIAFFWDFYNFLPGNPGKVYFRRSSEEAILQYSDVPFETGILGDFSKKLSAQVVLRPDDSIRIYYREVGRKDSATIGVKGGDPGEYHQVAYNEAFVGDESVLLLKPDLSFGRVVGDISGSITNEPSRVEFLVDTAARSAGTYDGNIVIESNDATGNTPLRIPVTLHVRSRIYEDFMERHRVPASLRGLQDDGDRDGIANLLEFAFGLDPSGRNPKVGLPSLTVSPPPSTHGLPVISLEYRRRTDASGLEYRIEGSDNLDTWSTMAPASESTLLTEDPAVEKVLSVMAPDPSKPAYFFRVRVEMN